MKDSDVDAARPVLIRDRARALRTAPTEVEKRLWQRLRNRQLNGAKFRRQHPIGTYIADFFCLDARIVIELDGSQHADEARQRADVRRTGVLAGPRLPSLAFLERGDFRQPRWCAGIHSAAFLILMSLTRRVKRAGLSRQGEALHPSGRVFTRGLSSGTVQDLR